MATIAHLDADAFYVSIELLRHPELRGRPVVVAGDHPRAVVTTASYEARAYGIFSATPAARARRLCPEAVFIEPDFAAYRAASRRLMAIVAETVEVVEIVGLDEAYLDLSDLLNPRTAMRGLATRIEREVGLSCSIGIGPNKLVAKVASDADKPRGLVALTREQACERFADAHPRLLPGIGPKTAQRLDALGLRTLEALRQAPAELLAERFGPRLGRDLKRRASFEHDGSVQPVREVVSRSNETTFATDVSDPLELAQALERLARRLCAGLGEQGVRGRTVGIKVRLDDFTTATRARTLTLATNDADLVVSVAQELLAAYAPPRPVRLLGVRLAAFESNEAAPASGSGGDPQLALAV